MIVEKIANPLLIVFSVAFALVYLFAPTQTATQILSPYLPLADKFYFLIIGSLGFSIFVVAYPSFKKPAKDPRFYPAISVPWLGHFKIAVSLLVVFQLLNGLQLPLTYDEMNIGGAIANLNFTGVLKLFWKGVHRYTSTQHHISTLTAFFSMKLFGPNELALRLSALPFTVGFLITLFRFTKKHTSNMGVLLIYLNLLANANVTYYLISPRCYAAMMLFSLLSLSLVWDAIEMRSLHSRFTPWFFAVSFLLTILTNTNAGLFGSLLFLATIFYFFLNRKDLTRVQQRIITTYLLIMAVILPIFALETLREISVQSGLSQLTGINPELNLGTIGYLLGMDKILMSKVLILFCLLIWIYRTTIFKIKKDFLNLFLSLSFCAIFLILVILKVYSYAPRYSIAFLVPLLCWIGQSISILPKTRLRRLALAFALILCVALPSIRQSEFLNSICGQYREAHSFLVGARELLSTPQTCVVYLEDSFETVAAKEFYLFGKRECSFNSMQYRTVIASSKYLHIVRDEIP